MTPLLTPTAPTPAELEAMLAERLGLDPAMKEDFLSPKYQLADPFLFADMERAVARLYQAVKAGEEIGIYADYDCDGIPAAVVLLDLFKILTVKEHAHVYIPDRHEEGYGISAQGIDELERAGVTLMISVDVGITALAEVADAQSRGIDCIITDHHTPLPEYPAAHAVVHPAKGEYPNKDLCGAGVAFMLVRAFLQKHGAEFGVVDGWEKWLLDMVGFATLSDMVPIGKGNGTPGSGENRILATFGLMVMRKTRRVGLRALFAATGLSLDRLTETDLTFTVAPRLNAASRMDTPMLAFELLATDDPARAQALAIQLESINNDRKLLVARIVKDAHARLDKRELPAIVVLGDLTWRPAVLGLVANKLQETYGRSFFVWGGNGSDILKGSCRMHSTHHAAQLFQSLPADLLIASGGHQAAGGFSVTKEKVHFLEEALNAALAATEANADEEKGAGEAGNTSDANGERGAIPASISITTLRHYHTIRRFAPFGVGNEEPAFLFNQVTVSETKKFGKTKEHLECVIADETGKATAFTFFAAPTLISKLSPGETVSFTATLEPGWRSGMRLRIRDLR